MAFTGGGLASHQGGLSKGVPLYIKSRHTVASLDHQTKEQDTVPSHIIRNLAWHSGSVMDCHVIARGLTTNGNSVKNQFHVFARGQ